MRKKICERNFYPVGHGGFHGEKIGDDFHFIFDCGSKTKKVINDAIDKYYQHIFKIDLLVISHFHDDHYKGLKKLVKEKKVERIMIPFLSEEQKIKEMLKSIVKLEKNESDNSFDFDEHKDNIRIIYSPKEYLDELRFEGQILTVKNDKEEFRRKKVILEQLDSVEITIQNGQRIVVSRRDGRWMYIPFNLRIDESSNILLNKELSELLETSEKTTDILFGLKNKIITLGNSELKKLYTEIRGIYKKYCGEINEYSLCIYSGIYNNFRENKTGCLYTGDYKALGQNLRELKKEYRSVLKTISWLQIPHHGSIHNFDSDLIFDSVRNCFVNVPERKKINKKTGEILHPSSKVVSDIRNKGCKVYELNESSYLIKLFIFRIGLRDIYSLENYLDYYPYINKNIIKENLELLRNL